MPAPNIPIILASTSPRRKELLELFQIPFLVQKPPVDETILGDMSPSRQTEILAERKARSILDQFPEGLIISADTLVVVGHKTFGKPKNDTDAFRILKSLRNRSHEVVTGLCVLDIKSGNMKLGHRSTLVHMKPLPDDTIYRYIQTGEPFDKAGAYAIQGRGAILVRAIEGDYNNVVGLPLSLLADYLDYFDVQLI